MPRGSPFTALCQMTAALSRPVVADLHAHTTCSDGDYTPGQLVMLARQARLTALAITDHDTTDGVAPARQAALGSRLEVVAGVECSAEFDGRELHILGYYISPDDTDFQAHLRGVQARRETRFDRAVAQLEAAGIAFTPGLVDTLKARTSSLGRRHLSGLLVQSGVVATHREAFEQHLRALDPPVAPIHLTPADETVRRIHSAGGIASLAHPPRDLTDEQFSRLRDLGLDAIEVYCPSASPRVSDLLAVATRLGFAVTGGTDTHGPPPPDAARPRKVGSFGLGHAQFQKFARR